ncbi:MAG: NAD(P)/FAD-dependent oxidoreductase [Acidimicrobiales bacterium]
MSKAAHSAPDFDVAIIGGGPGGAGMASYLAKAGVSAVVLERELFPRPHVGESLVPSSTRVFREIDFLDQMESGRFPRKYGAAWTAATSSPVAQQWDHDWEPESEDLPAADANGAGDAPGGPDGISPEDYVDVRFSEREQPGVGMNYTWHVDRGQFDLLLLQHANTLGAEVYEGVNVQGADFSDPGQVSVKFAMGRKQCEVSSRIVVDASGRRTLLGNQLGWKVKDPVFDQYALHTWFSGYDRSALADGPDKEGYIYIHFLPMSNSWVWQIPITSDITSVGVVTQKSNFARRKTEHESFFWQCLETRPELAQALRSAEQIRPFKTEGDYSYSMRNIVGDRVALIGDAARFVDPIFSTGVSIALNSARFASRDVLAALESGHLGRESFATYEATIRRGTKNWYEFISMYYRLNVLFTAFVGNPRYRLDVLKLLQGDVYDEDEPAVLQKMREIVTEVERNPRHMLHKYLGDLTANAFAPAF